MPDLLPSTLPNGLIRMRTSRHATSYHWTREVRPDGTAVSLCGIYVLRETRIPLRCTMCAPCCGHLAREELEAIDALLDTEQDRRREASIQQDHIHARATHRPRDEDGRCQRGCGEWPCLAYTTAVEYLGGAK